MSQHTPSQSDAKVSTRNPARAEGQAKLNKNDSSNTAVLNAAPVTARSVDPVTCTIGLDSFFIKTTRSLHKDTDFVTVSLAIANRPTLSQTRAVGDVGDGNHALNMSFPHVSIAPHETAVLTYAIVNSGHQDSGKVIQTLEQAIKDIATLGAKFAASEAGAALGATLGASIGTAAVPFIGTAVGAVAGYLLSKGFNLLFANCDGPVAAAVRALTYDQIKAVVASGKPQPHTDDHPGVNSPHGCGANSHYTVTWSVK